MARDPEQVHDEVLVVRILLEGLILHKVEDTVYQEVVLLVEFPDICHDRLDQLIPLIQHTILDDRAEGVHRRRDYLEDVIIG